MLDPDVRRYVFGRLIEIPMAIEAMPMPATTTTGTSEARSPDGPRAKTTMARTETGTTTRNKRTVARLVCGRIASPASIPRPCELVSRASAGPAAGPAGRVLPLSPLVAGTGRIADSRRESRSTSAWKSGSWRTGLPFLKARPPTDSGS